MPKLKERKMCMFPDKCEYVSEIRGMCHGHWNLCRTVVKKGIRTWEDFERNGYCLKSIQGKSTERSIKFYGLIEKMK